MKHSKKFLDDFVDSMLYLADEIQDSVIQECEESMNPVSPYLYLVKVMEAQDNIKEMAKRGLIPEETAKKALEALDQHLGDGCEWASDYYQEATEKD